VHPSTLPFVEPLAHGIHAIDTGFHRDRFDAAYLIVENGRAAFVDTGTNHSVPRLLAALDAAGLAPDAVDHVIATHVHLDHAGGVGLLMQHLPAATLVVHPHGAQHLIDPTRLMVSARGVYGDEEVARTYGELVPVPASRVERTADGSVLSLAGRALTFLDTPGHARHHHCVWDARSRGFFSGDTFGISYREFDTERGAWLMPTTTPVQFEPEAMHRSVQRMLEHAPERLYPTHFGPVGRGVADLQRMAGLMLAQLDAMVALVRAAPVDASTPVDASAPGDTSGDAAAATSAATERHAVLVDGLMAIHRASLRAHGCALADAEVAELLALDVELNAQGLAVWLAKEGRSRQRSASPSTSP
jgi:glyoxylase-like metal-dependent hydrolase (beta-lactamase superfamily II)